MIQTHSEYDPNTPWNRQYEPQQCPNYDMRALILSSMGNQKHGQAPQENWHASCAGIAKNYRTCTCSGTHQQMRVVTLTHQFPRHQVLQHTGP